MLDVMAQGGVRIRRRGNVSQNGVLARVLSRQHVRAVYQPIRHLDSRAVAGYEALARPADMADDGSVADFFRAARQQGQMPDIEWLCRRAALDGAKSLPADTFLSLNLDHEVLRRVHVDADALLQILAGAGRDPATIVVEVSPPRGVTVPDLMRTLVPYRVHGIRIAITGVGIEEEKQLASASPQPDFVKLCRICLASLGDPAHRAVAARMAQRRRAGGPTPIGEGIEREETAAMLLELGFTLGQGYLLGRPSGLDHEGRPVVSAAKAPPPA
ncbi:MAG: EAL domain-containing protein [Candidatus Dormibacteria bacterium]